VVLVIALSLVVMLVITALAVVIKSKKVDMSSSPWTKERLIALYDETIALAGGGEWTTDFSRPIECTTAAGGPGVQFDLQRVGPGTDEASETVAKVRALWQERGITTVQSTRGRGTIETIQQSLDKHRFTVAFDAGDKAMVLDGLSACLAEKPKAPPSGTDEPAE
jgi:hypothetical protein